MNSVRDDLIDAVRHGRISPDDADAEAMRLGLTPLSYRPDPAEFDPLQEAYWTPVMAIAWIAWRTADAVREGWAEYVAKCRSWRFKRWRVGPDGDVHEGYWLEDDDPPSIARLHLIEFSSRAVGREQNPVILSIADARDSLLDALKTGRLEATGQPTQATGKRQVVPAIEWVDLQFDHETPDGNVDTVAAQRHAGYTRVLVDRERILTLWPVPREKGPPAPLPAAVRPDGPGYMTVSAALQWIATMGEQLTLTSDDGDRIQNAFQELMPRIASGLVQLTGRKLVDAKEPREIVPPYVVADCRFDHPFEDTHVDLQRGKDLYLRCWAWLDEQHWREAFDDALLVGPDKVWDRLMVPKEAIIAHWRFGANAPQRTGAPGRPTSMHLIVEEFFRRRDALELKSTVTEEARALREWLVQSHPQSPVPTAKTIRTRISADYRAAKRA